MSAVDPACGLKETRRKRKRARYFTAVPDAFAEIPS